MNKAAPHAGRFRRLIETGLRDLRFWRRLPPELGRAPILMSTAAGLKALVRGAARIDPELIRNARELIRPGDIVWDVGANVGLFSVTSMHRFFQLEHKPAIICQGSDPARPEVSGR